MQNVYMLTHAEYMENLETISIPSFNLKKVSSTITVRIAIYQKPYIYKLSTKYGGKKHSITCIFSIVYKQNEIQN